MYEDPEFHYNGASTEYLAWYRCISAKAVASLKVVLIIVVIALLVKGKRCKSCDPWQNYICINNIIMPCI